MMPTLLVIEDGHWIDDASRDLLRSPRRGARAPALARLRDEAAPGRRVRRLGATAIVRARARSRSTRGRRALALAAAGEVALSDEVLAALVERAGGNPLFVRELVAAARHGERRRDAPGVGREADHDAHGHAGAGRPLAAPERVRPRRRASSSTCCARSSRTSSPTPATWSAGSGWREFVAWEATSLLRFLHDLFRAAAYEGLSFRRRREIHGRVGARSRSGPASARRKSPALLSLHFLAAGEHEKAWRYSVAAGGRRRTFANVEATELYERALDAARRARAPAGRGRRRRRGAR